MVVITGNVKSNIDRYPKRLKNDDFSSIKALSDRFTVFCPRTVPSTALRLLNFRLKFFIT